MTDDLPPRDPVGAEGAPAERTPSTGRTGVTIGILVVVLAALLFYFYWRSTGALDSSGHRPTAPAATTP
ncbi:MAG: hypothetical protein WKG32_19700 [Gemmatimonadaceae bacterium]